MIYTFTHYRVTKVCKLHVTKYLKKRFIHYYISILHTHGWFLCTNTVIIYLWIMKNYTIFDDFYHKRFVLSLSSEGLRLLMTQGYWKMLLLRRWWCSSLACRREMVLLDTVISNQKLADADGASSGVKSYRLAKQNMKNKPEN